MCNNVDVSVFLHLCPMGNKLYSENTINVSLQVMTVRRDVGIDTAEKLLMLGFALLSTVQYKKKKRNVSNILDI